MTSRENQEYWNEDQPTDKVGCHQQDQQLPVLRALLTGNTAQPQWVGTRESYLLVLNPQLCSAAVTKKGSMLRVAANTIRNTTGIPMDPESGLVLEKPMTTTTRVETDEATVRGDNGDKHIKAMGNILVQ